MKRSDFAVALAILGVVALIIVGALYQYKKFMFFMGL